MRANVFLFSFLGLLSLAVRPAGAQAAPTPAVPVTPAMPVATPEEEQQAKNRWTEGKAYFDAGNFEAARVAFKQAHTIFPHPAFLQNLGEAELRTGRYVEAARHLAAFVRSDAPKSAAQREGAKKSLQRASEKLGSIVVETNVPEAEVRVDGEVVGRSPLGTLNWYVEPGAHAVRASKAGFLDGEEKVAIAAGPPKSVYVRLSRVLGPLPEDPPPAPAPTSPPAPAVASVPTEAPSTVDVRTIVIVSEAVLAAGALATGIGFELKARSDESTRDSGIDQLPVAEEEKRGACAKVVSDLATRCAAIARYSEAASSDRQIRNIAFVTAGGLTVATVLTLLLWTPSKGQVSFAPMAGPALAGFQLRTTF